LEDHHKSKPESAGVPRAKLLVLSRVPARCFDAAMPSMVKEGRIAYSEASQCFARAGWEPRLPEAIAGLCERTEALFRERLYNPPNASEAAREIGVEEGESLHAMKVLKEFGRLVETHGGVIFHSKAIREATIKVSEHIKSKGRLESVDFKYLIDTTRKYALPLLDHLDGIGVTRRVGNTRFLKNPAK